MKNAFGQLSLAGGIALLYDEVIGLVMSEVLDIDAWGIRVPEVILNLVGLILLAVAFALFNLGRIRAWLKKRPLEDLQTQTGRRVFVNRSINLEGARDHDFENAIFIDCQLFGSCAAVLEGTVDVRESMHFQATNSNSNVIWSMTSQRQVKGSLTFRNCILINTQVRTRTLIFTNHFISKYDSEFNLNYEQLPDSVSVNERGEIISEVDA